MKKILGAAIAASMLAAGAANAAIDNGASQEFGNGEMFIVLFDDVAKKSVIVDLGLDYNDVIGHGATLGQATGEAVNFSSNISTAITAAFGSNLSNVRWNVAGRGSLSFDADFNNYFNEYGSIFTGPSTYNPSPNDVASIYDSSISGLLANTGDYTNGDQSSSNPTQFAKRSIDNFYVALDDQTALYAGGATWGYKSRYASWDTSLLGSGSLDSYWFHYNDVEGSTAARTQLGSWSLNLATGALSYVQGGGTSEVPVPAAAWLLVSGLAGLGTVARRRKQA